MRLKRNERFVALFIVSIYAVVFLFAWSMQP